MRSLYLGARRQATALRSHGIPAISAQTKVPGCGLDEFQKLAEAAKANCPVSKVLNAAITLDATLG